MCFAVLDELGRPVKRICREGRGAAQEVVDRMVAGLGGTARAVERVLARTEGGLVDSEYGSEDEPDESNP